MIRIAQETDVPQILAIYAPYILSSTHTFEYDVPTEAEFLERFRRITAQFPWLVWEENGQILGYAYGSAPFERAAFGWCAESSIYLRPEVRGRGIGKKLNTALEKILTRQGYQLLYAISTAENTSSIAFHQHLGYTFLARFDRCGYKFGRWLGIVWMQKPLNFVDIPTSAPIPWIDISENHEIFPDILDILSLS